MSRRTSIAYQAFGLGPRFPRSGLVNRLRFRAVNLPGEFRISQALATNRANHDREPLRIVHAAVAESARLFVDVPEQVERFHADVGSVERPLQKTPEVLHPVGMDVSVRVLDSVIDDGVLIVCLQPFIRFQFVTEDSGPGFNLFVDVLLKFLFFAVVNHKGPNFPAALDHTHNDGLIFAAGTGDALFAFRLMHVPGLTADEGFIHFDFPAQLTAALLALLSKADAVEQKPRGLLGDAQRPRDFATTDPVFRVLKHPHCRKPLIQADGGIFHDGSDLHGELAALVPDAALPSQLVGQEPNRGATATRADYAVFPFWAARHEVLQAVPWVGKVADRFQEGLGFVKGFHTSSVPQNRVLVKYIFAQHSVYKAVAQYVVWLVVNADKRSGRIELACRQVPLDAQEPKG